MHPLPPSIIAFVGTDLVANGSPAEVAAACQDGAR